MIKVISRMARINRIGILAIILLISVSFADPSTNLSNALVSFCLIAKNFLGLGIMLMILLAGATYAIGQLLGAETRARASVWATAMLTGAIIGAVIYIVTPTIVQAIIGTGGGVTVSC
ncbi:hypothetical protein KKB44_03690 [Candidatus Micrarchaeota archaeon]|nr:hypothetical protein [Candidatus Micrarchaeota archaeon]